jgi:hypothetical protein
MKKRVLFWGVLVVVGIAAALMARTYAAEIPVSTPDSAHPLSAADKPQPLSPNPRVPLEKIVSGTVAEVRESYILVTDPRHGLITLHLSPETRIWKGRWDSGLPVEVGDFFYGYGEPNEDGTVYEMEQMEVNIVSLRGAVISVKKVSEGLDVQLDDVREGRSYSVHITSETLVSKEEGEAPFAQAQFDLKVGDGVQIIGLKLKDGSVVATRVF